MAGICTRTGADLAIGAAAPAGATLPDAETDGVGAGAASLEQPARADGDDGQQGGHPRQHPGTGEAGVPLRNAMTHAVQVLSCPGAAVE